MATSINDFANATRLAQTFGPISTTSEDFTTDTVDLINGDGPAFAIISVGEMEPNATLAATLQGSDNGSTWTDLDDGAFPEAVALSNSLRAYTFRPAKRYVRLALTINNDSSAAPVAAIIGQCRKLI
jgi:hypothetical protein